MCTYLSVCATFSGPLMSFISKKVVYIYECSTMQDHSVFNVCTVDILLPTFCGIVVSY